MKKYLLLAALFAFTGTFLFSQPTINGDMSDAGYTTIGSFTSGQNSFGDNNCMGAIRYATDNTNIYLGITGELSSNDNIVLFFNFSEYGGRSGALGGSGSCSTGAFSISSNASFFGLDGAVMDMDIDFALAFNEGNSGSNFYLDAARYGNTGMLSCGYLGDTGSQSGGTGSFNVGSIFGGTGNITLAYHNGYAGNSNNGVEFSIPIAAFAGVGNTQTLQVFAIITNIAGLMSNETIPGDPGGSNLGNDANLANISGQDFFTAAYALPVELIDFQGFAGEACIKLKWQTASETGNDFFEIQRSADARTWQALGVVEGAGFSTTLRSYEFLDEAPLHLNFYRLRQVDFDQTFSFSKVISVEFKDARSPRLSPNPAEHELAIDFEEEPEPGSSAQFFDQTGKLAFEAVIQPGKKCLLDISQLSPGLYFLKIKGKNREVIWQDRFVKK